MTSFIMNNNNIHFKHDGSTSLTIFDEPSEYSHISEKGSKRLQPIEMMEFQSKIASLASIELRNLNIPTPLLKSKYEVEISVASCRNIDELPLLLLMKSIVDGLNKRILSDDADVYKCSINYHPKKQHSRHSRTEPLDWLTLKVIDLNSSRTIIAIHDLNIHLVHKKNPYILEPEDDVLPFWYGDIYLSKLWDALNKQSFTIPSSSSYQVTMKFVGAVGSKDVDNLALFFYPLIELNEYFSLTGIRSITLEKEYDSYKSHTEIQIIPLLC
ncbi:hypothetical protein [Schinkia azotoformans]|uniref:hypothetical protein n=1 Tax=Schinkia azotoformans TaxID=1454 RepID=UPI002DB7F518|nr:hypothetical protein [Schinkia azotoformans]MEC1778324.1 hypothetical protein [Schinkia azotoformans]MED4331969.1 hypothetical protein [Schinkia azotoformans]